MLYFDQGAYDVSRIRAARRSSRRWPTSVVFASIRSGFSRSSRNATLAARVLAGRQPAVAEGRQRRSVRDDQKQAKKEAARLDPRALLNT